MKKIIRIAIGIIIVIGIGMFVCNENFININSNQYLTAKEEKRSVLVHENQKCTKDSMSFDFNRFTGKWSFFELDCKEGNKITIKDNSKIDKGKLFIVVLDSNYNIIAMKEEKNKEDIEFSAPKDGKYLLRIVGEKASGHFDISIKSDGDLETVYKDFWS